MDRLDHGIIEILRDDGRASNASIARGLGVSEGTVRRRLGRLVSGKFVRIVALPDPARLGLDAEALVAVRVDAGHADRVADEVSALAGVGWVAVTTGPYDLFAWVTLESSAALGSFLRKELGSIEGVRSSETFVSLAPRRLGRGVGL